MPVTVEQPQGGCVHQVHMAAHDLGKGGFVPMVGIFPEQVVVRGIHGKISAP